MKPILAGDRNKCVACGLLFKSTSGHSAHRYGDFTNVAPHYGRACRTPAELAALGYLPNTAGFFRKPRAYAA